MYEIHLLVRMALWKEVATIEEPPQNITQKSFPNEGRSQPARHWLWINEVVRLAVLDEPQKMYEDDLD